MTEQVAGKFERVVIKAEGSLDLRVGTSAREIIGRKLASPSEDATIQAIKAARAKIHFWSDPMQIIEDGMEPITDSHGNQRTLFLRRYSDDQIWLHSTPTSPTHR